MKYIDSKSILELSDIDQEIIIREFQDDMDQGYNIEDYKDLIIEIYEYNPKLKEDRLILEDFLSQKISNEGEPLEEDLEYYLDNLDQLINFPILVKQGLCGEGRHRLAVALRTNHRIRAYIF